MAEFLLSKRAAPNVPSLTGSWTALHLAAQYQQAIEIVRMLIMKRPSTLHFRGADGNLPLHLAAAHNSAEVVSLLLEADELTRPRMHKTVLKLLQHFGAAMHTAGCSQAGRGLGGRSDAHGRLLAARQAGGVRTGAMLPVGCS